MLSRRNFFTITLIMLVLFFMFQFSGVIKEVWNDYETNEYEETDKKEESTLKNEATFNEITKEKVVFIGETKNTALGKTVSQWVSYTKRNLESYTSIQDYQPKEDQLPEVLLIDASHVNFESDTKVLIQWAHQGVNMIFCNLPPYQQIAENEELKTLLGIRTAKSEQVNLKGIQLFSGFLLGGEAIYTAQTKEESKRQDMVLEVPWYITNSGTKTYMVGLLDDEKIENEDLPGIIWRNSIGETNIFVVNGNYLQDNTGIGFLDAMMSEMHDYEIYPVVNAQNLVIANYPGMASENEEKMNQYYSRSLQAVYRDIIWPGISAVSDNINAKPTYMLALQLDYTDHNQPQEKELIYYLKLLKELDAEAGLSASQVSDIQITDKLGLDYDFLNKNVKEYAFCSFYIGTLGKEDTQAALQTKALKNVTTLLKDYNKNEDVIGYTDETKTIQSATINGFSHTYTEDLRVRSLETALGYSNILVDMERVAYPQSNDDTWEKLSEQFSSNTDTYWKNFTAFDQTVLSESDTRIRQLFTMDYTDSRDGNMITLDIHNPKEKTWFILRTHGEKIKKITGASYKTIEDGAYLIEAKKNKVKITLQSNIELYYYE